ncbi:MAG: hypothetical protein GQ573_02175 [Gammaproteobacteria bacterium]|jgi:hypothetical protein|nr:hypothetical protein [Gammaproteobacteria bacterium]
MRLIKIISPLFLSVTFASANVMANDADADGVADKLDKCPNTAQLKKLPADFKYGVAVDPERLKPEAKAFPVDENGCEFDTDGDGIINSKDYCPEDTAETLSKGIAVNGCPKQSDADGTPDYRDNCPDTPKGVKVDNLGCPV